MAVLDVTEYAELAYAGTGHRIPAGQEPSLRQQQVSVGASSAQSLVFADATRFVRIHSDVACRVAVGVNPTASASSMRVVGGGTEYLGVLPGLKIAVIATT